MTLEAVVVLNGFFSVLERWSARTLDELMDVLPSGHSPFKMVAQRANTRQWKGANHTINQYSKMYHIEHNPLSPINRFL